MTSFANGLGTRARTVSLGVACRLWAPPQARPAARPVPLRPARPGVAVVAPERHGDLEQRSRTCAAPRTAQRGYVEVKTPLIYDDSLWKTSGHWEKFRDDMFLVPEGSESQTYGLKPMNCPGHMLLFGTAPQLSRPAAALRRVVDAAPQRAAGALHGLTPGAARDPGRRPHLLQSRPDRGRDLRVPRLRRPALRHLRRRTARRALAPGPTTSSAPTRSGTSPRRRSSPRSSAAASTTSRAPERARSTAQRSTCT